VSLKARYFARKKDCLVNIELAHWERLKVYWSKLETEKKVEQMNNVKSKMKNMGNVGRLGRVGKQTRLVVD
jgi:hypothetical protein